MHRFGGAAQEINLDTIEDLEAFTAGGWGKVAKENVPKDEFSLHIPKSTVAVIHLPDVLPHHPLDFGAHPSMEVPCFIQTETKVI